MSETPTFDPEAKRLRDLQDREVFLNNRPRVISAAVVAVVWAFYVGESKALADKYPNAKCYFVWAATLGVAALACDYFQILLEYLELRLRKIYPKFGKLLSFGAKTMFVGKQLLAFAAAGLLIIGGGLLLKNPPPTRADYDIWNHVTSWTGHLKLEGKPSMESQIVLDKAHNYTPGIRKLCAMKDDSSQCLGWLYDDVHLVLKCEGITLEGDVAGQSSKYRYTGHWSSATGKGDFDYDFIQSDPNYPRLSCAAE